MFRMLHYLRNIGLYFGASGALRDEYADKLNDVWSLNLAGNHNGVSIRIAAG